MYLNATLAKELPCCPDESMCTYPPSFFPVSFFLTAAAGNSAPSRHGARSPCSRAPFFLLALAPCKRAARLLVSSPSSSKLPSVSLFSMAPRHPSAVQQEVQRLPLPPGLGAPPCSLKPAPMVARLQPLGVLLPPAAEHRLLVFLAELTFPLSSNGKPLPGRTFARCSWSLPARPQCRLAMAPPAISSPWRDASAPFLHGQRPCSYLQPLLVVLCGARRLFDEMSSCCRRARCPSPRNCSLDVVVEPSLLWLPPKDSALSPSQHRRLWQNRPNYSSLSA
jgi:hypothetical protein